MGIKDLEIICGENSYQTASIEENDKTIDYDVHGELSFVDIMTISKGLNIISEFFDVNAVVTALNNGVCAAALGKSLEDAYKKTIDSNPVDYMNAIVLVSAEVNSEIAKLLAKSNKIVAPKFTPQAIELLEKRGITYVSIKTPLKDFKQFLQNDVKVTPLGTLVQSPNTSELSKETFKVVSKTKPNVEQIEDAVFAWKIAKHVNSQAIVIAKDLRTSAISQSSVSSEFAIDYACDASKDAILASDMPITIHDINAAAQGRIALIIVPFAANEIINAADKFNISVITTGITNILY